MLCIANTVVNLYKRSFYTCIKLLINNNKFLQLNFDKLNKETYKTVIEYNKIHGSPKCLEKVANNIINYFKSEIKISIHN